MQACTEALEIAKANNPDQLDTNTLINHLEIVLKNNTFQFNGKSYIQLQGMAMGTKLVPAYANIFMGKLEHTILSSAPLNHHTIDVTLMTSLSFGCTPLRNSTNSLPP